MLELSEYERYIANEKSAEEVRSAADLPTLRAKNNLPTLAIGGLRLHSSIDPRAEAEALIESMHAEITTACSEAMNEALTIIVFGPGLGYVITALENHIASIDRSPKLKVICVEAEPSIARKALELRVWEPAKLSISWFVRNGADELGDSLNGESSTLIIRTTAGYRLNREFYENLASTIDKHMLPERPLRVLVPTPLYGGSYPISLHCADALRELGHQVKVLDLSSYYAMFRGIDDMTSDAKHRKTLQGLLTTYIAELIAAAAMDWNADLVWAVAQTPLTPTALQELRHEGIHSAFWFVEDFRVFSYWRELAPHFDAIFTIQHGQFLGELQNMGVKHAVYLPCAANPKIHKPLQMSPSEKLRFGSDVAFVGAGYYNRQKLFEQIRIKNLKIWGNDWPENSAVTAKVQENGRRVSPEETAMIYGSTKVNLNLHSSPVHSAINPTGDYLNPRTFEIAACEGFQIVDYRSDLPELFSESEVATIRSADEIPNKIGYYLEHEAERREMASKARQRVLSEHTYVHRMKSAIEYLENNFVRLAHRKRGPNYVSSLKKAAEGDRELLDFLSQFEDEQEVTLDDIVSKIKVGESKLSRAEGIFLLMKEFRDWGREKGVIQ